jgi:hypothetical protein
VSKQLDIEGSDRTLTVSDNFHIDDPYHPLTLHRVDLEPDNPDSLNYKMYLFFFREKTFDSLPATVVCQSFHYSHPLYFLYNRHLLDPELSESAK